MFIRTGIAGALALLLNVATQAAASEITDSAGRRVTAPAQVTRLLPAGPPADVLLYALAPDLLIGLTEPFSPAQGAAAPGAPAALVKVPRITGKLSDAEVGDLRALKPDLVVDYGDVNPDFTALAERLQGELAAPYLLLDGGLKEIPASVRKLGAALGRPQRAEEIATEAQHALDRLAALAPAARVSVYYARGKDGLQAARDGSSLGAAVTLAGARNVTPAGKGALTTLTIDEVARLAPQVVIFADPAAADAANPLRQALPAGTRYLVDRGLPYPLLEKPPSINRLIGALVLAEILYPTEAQGFIKEAQALAAAFFPGAAVNVSIGN